MKSKVMTLDKNENQNVGDLLRSFIADSKLSSAKFEPWKFTKIEKILELNYQDSIIDTPLNNQKAPAFSFPVYSIEFSNGTFLKKSDNFPNAVKIYEEKVDASSLINLKNYPFADFNFSCQKNVKNIKISIDENTNLDCPIAIIHNISSDVSLLNNFRISLSVAKNSKVDFIELFQSQNAQAPTLTNVVNQIDISENATVNHYRLQEDSEKSFNITLNIVGVKSSASYHNVSFQNSGCLSRNETKVVLCEENAQTSLNALYHIGKETQIDNTTYVKHLAPHTFSDQLIKGVAKDRAKSVFQGKIHIAKNADKVVGNQLHKALLLSNTAEIDCKPELEIFADDVKCSHGAATGVLDKMQLFYLQSRGISEEDAKQMLIDAYFDDVLNKIDNNDIKDWIIERI